LNRSRRSANAIEHDAALTGQVMEAVNEFYSKRTPELTRRRSSPGRGAVIKTPEQLMRALTNGD
jgi:hypothetical protein